MEQSLEMLPPRRKPNKDSLQMGKSCILHTNLYEVNMKESTELEQYVIDTQPAIEDEGIELFRRVIWQKSAEVREAIGLLTFKGRTMWGTRKIQKPIVLKIDRCEKEHIMEDYQVLIKHTRSISYNEIFSLSAKERRQILQIYTVALKQKINKMGMKETTRCRFLQKEEGEDVKGYKILMCYQLKLMPIQRKLNLLIDVGFRILSHLNALQELSNLGSKDVKQAFAVGRTVVTTYNNRAYRIEKIRFDLNPFSTFYMQKKQKEITFADYFKEYYKLAVMTKNQPLFETTISYKNEVKDKKSERVQRKGWLIPEFCRFSALLAKIKEKDFHTFNDISKKIKIDPQARKNQEIKLIANLNNEPGSIYVSDKCSEVEGVVYEELEVVARKKLMADRGTIKGLKEIKEPMKLVNQNWLFVYSNTSNTQDDQDFALDSFKALKDSGGYYGISVAEPQFVEVEKQGPENWIKSIEAKLSQKPKLKQTIKIVLLLLAPNQKNYYGELKTYITNVLRLPCQMVLKKTMGSKNRLTICGKILLQMNAKIGFPLWTVPLKHPYWKKKTIMYGGLSVSKNVKPQKGKGTNQENKANYVAGFVGTYTEDLSKIYANVALVENLKDLEKMEVFEGLMIDWIKYYFINQKCMPDAIILYREGLTERQIETQGRAEVEALKRIVERARTKVPNYQPQLIYILVVKRASKRVYRPERAQSSGKFAPHVMRNPVPGTMVFESISTDKVFDFHLTAQCVTEGTTTLTQYQIAYDASEIPEQAIAQFTLQQCYNYPNWMGGISVPGCLQSADKLSKLVGEHIHQNIAKETSNQNIRLKPFYL